MPQIKWDGTCRNSSYHQQIYYETITQLTDLQVSAAWHLQCYQHLKKKSLNWFVKMYALNGAFFHLTEKNTQITLNIDGTLSKRMLCTSIHLSWKDKLLFLPATEMLNQLWLEQDAIKILRAVGLKTDYFIKLTTCR